MPSLLPLSDHDRDEILRLFDTKDLMRAVLSVRRATGAGFADVLFTLDTFLRKTGRIRDPAVNALRWEILTSKPYRNRSGYILAVGPRGKAVDANPAREKEGSIVMTWLIEVFDDELKLHELAACFQADPWDFNTHEFDPWRADLQALQAFEEVDECEGLVDDFVALRAAGFKFYLWINPNW